MAGLLAFLKRQVTRLLGDADTFALAGMLCVALGAWFFLELADEVGEGSTQRFDEWVVRGLRDPADLSNPVGPAWFEEAVRDLTSLGSVAILLTVCVAAVGYLWMVRAYHAAWLTLASSVGGLVLGLLLKGIFNRPRPDVVPHLMDARHSSFPSGHSLNAAVVYLTLGLILAEVVPRRRQKVYFLVLAVTLTVAVGCSRVYLGVHYPTDVLAGWLVGAAWALACTLMAHRLKRAGAIESVGVSAGTESL